MWIYEPFFHKYIMPHQNEKNGGCPLLQEAYLKTERFQTFVCGTRPKGRGMASLIN